MILVGALLMDFGGSGLGDIISVCDLEIAVTLYSTL